MSRILMIASEAAPLIKTGGLGDVLGALPQALREFGHRVAVVIPRYGPIDLKGTRRVYDHIPIFLGPARHDTAIYQAGEEVPIFLVDCPPLYDRAGVYGEAGEDYPDNYIRFAVFARAALGVARFLFRPDVLHCHDWQAGLVPVYLRTVLAADPTFFAAKTLLTLHNLGYQGLFPKAVLPELALNGAGFRPDAMDFFGRVSYLKGGIVFADALNAVSPTYAREIRTPDLGFGLDSELRSRADVLTGILNGADYEEWNPETDPLIPARYSSEELGGKQLCKRDLLLEFGLPASAMGAPLIGIVSRLVTQKGMDWIPEIAPGIVAEGMSLVAVGTGDPAIEESFRQMAAAYPERIAVRIDFDNALAHRIEAGADIFLMPSRYEPCGLNQMYSLRYGTVPVVRATGGLDDTIDKDTGFKFAEASAIALLEAIRAAGRGFASPDSWREMMRRGMSKDLSWKASAGAYSALYGRMLGRSQAGAAGASM
jgi:starch synthase